MLLTPQLCWFTVHPRYPGPHIPLQNSKSHCLMLSFLSLWLILRDRRHERHKVIKYVTSTLPALTHCMHRRLSILLFPYISSKAPSAHQSVQQWFPTLGRIRLRGMKGTLRGVSQKQTGIAHNCVVFWSWYSAQIKKWRSIILFISKKRIKSQIVLSHH